MLRLLFVEVDRVRRHSVLYVTTEKDANHLASSLSSCFDSDGSVASSKVHFRFVQLKPCILIHIYELNVYFRWKCNIPKHSQQLRSRLDVFLLHALCHGTAVSKVLVVETIHDWTSDCKYQSSSHESSRKVFNSIQSHLVNNARVLRDEDLENIFAAVIFLCRSRSSDWLVSVLSQREEKIECASSYWEQWHSVSLSMWDVA